MTSNFTIRKWNNKSAPDRFMMIDARNSLERVFLEIEDIFITFLPHTYTSQDIGSLPHIFTLHIWMHRQAQYRLAQLFGYWTVCLAAIRSGKGALDVHRFSIINHGRNTCFFQFVLDLLTVDALRQLHGVLRPTTVIAVRYQRQGQTRTIQFLAIPLCRLIDRC